MMFKDGTHLETDVILFSAGIRPEDRLARQAGLAVGERVVLPLMNNVLLRIRMFWLSANVRCGPAKFLVWWLLAIRWHVLRSALCWVVKPALKVPI